ncbi:MAG: lipopolysaccharide heptosyltransferase II [Deltaproteobacteria bacterium]|nr:lipopolysaccharide heptosyltransferase II [Deltaproteobacteria bacterium]
MQTAFLGDVVLTTPLFRALRRVAPDAHLTALVTPAAAPLLEADPHLDEVLTYDKKGGESLAAVLRRVRRARFDRLLAPHRSHRSGLLALFSGIPVRVGFADGALSWAYTRRVDRPLDHHEVDRNLALLRGLGHEPVEADRVLHVGYTEVEGASVEAMLEQAGVKPGARLAGLCPGSIWPTKRWGAEGFAAVARALADRGLRPVLLGGPDDAGVASEVQRLAGDRSGVLNAAGRTPLKALAAWMDRLSVLVTNDSAPLHVAAARGTPTVAVFGPTTRGLGFAPFHAAARVVEVSLSCRPCGLHGGRRCPEGHFRCMGDVTPDQVLRALDDVLGGAA